MKINLKKYQEKAVTNIVEKSTNFLNKNDDTKRTITFQAPTGSGKTVMMASVIEKLVHTAKENKNMDIAFVWLSIGKGELHLQSKKSLQKMFAGYPNVVSIEEVFGTTRTELLKNEVMVVNWEKIRSKDKESQEWKNIVMKDGEQTNFREMLDHTNLNKRKIILIIDESHSNSKAERGKEIIELISPSLTIEVSATPVLKLSGEDIVNGLGWIEKVNPQEVIDEEMIKDQIILNSGLENNKNIDSDILVLQHAINKRKELLSDLKLEGSDVNPLVLIQLPNKDNGEAILKTIKDYLLQHEGIAEGDERLAIWLNEVKEDDRNIEGIAKLDGKQEYLVFKQAIDTGWDCPRAQILLKFRESSSEVFNIQVLGRILRMPEQKHYENEKLNKAYVYTNTNETKFEIEEYSPKILGDQPAIRKEIYKPLNLTSFYLERADYQDIKADFKQILLKEFVTKLSLDESGQGSNIKKLTKDEWVFDTQKISQNIFKDVILEIEKLDQESSLQVPDGKHVENVNINERQVEFLSRAVLKTYMAPFTNIARSIPAMNTALFLVCRTLFGEKVTSSSLLGVQSFLILNKDKIAPIFLNAVEKYSVGRKKKAKEDTEKEIKGFEILEKDYFNKALEEEMDYANYLLKPCYLSKERPQTERNFEVYLGKQKDVVWWYKNGVSRRDYFGIKYEYKNETHVTYPDYLVQYKDGTFAIYEVKHDSDKDETTPIKHAVIQKYVAVENKKGKKFKGGIVVERNSEWVDKFNGDSI